MNKLYTNPRDPLTQPSNYLYKYITNVRVHIIYSFQNGEQKVEEEEEEQEEEDELLPEEDAEGEGRGLGGGKDSLTILKGGAEDEGVYVCEVENRAGRLLAWYKVEYSHPTPSTHGE